MCQPNCTDSTHANATWCCDRDHALDKELWDTLVTGLSKWQEGEQHSDMLMTGLYPAMATFIAERYED